MAGNKLYNSWEEAKEDITKGNKIKPCKYKKFSCLSDVKGFLDNKENHRMSNGVVYIDGACNADRVGTIVIFFGVNDVRNVSYRLEGEQTNQTAELTAAIVALQNTLNFNVR